MLLRLIISLISLLCTRYLANAQVADYSLEANKKGIMLLHASIKTMGGQLTGPHIPRYAMYITSVGGGMYQSPEPGKILHSPSIDTIYVDFAKQQYYHYLKYTQTRYVWNPIVCINGSEGYSLNGVIKSGRKINKPDIKSYGNVFRKLPLYLLQETLRDFASSIRAVGQVALNGKQQDVVTYTNAQNRLVTLFIDADTKLPTQYEILFVDGATGDENQVYKYISYARVGQYMLPDKCEVYRGGILVDKIQNTYDLDPNFAEKRLTFPDNYELLPAFVNNTVPYSLDTLATNVYMLQRVGSYNMLVVAFKDYLYVAEAPEEGFYSGISERAIDHIKQYFPTKPIKYVSFSHHHMDHGCGLRAFVAAGATVLATPGNEKFVRNLVEEQFTWSPDALAKNPKPLQLQIIQNKKHVLTDGDMLVEIYDIGPYWHANEETIVYLPKQKVLFEGDLFISGFSDNIDPAYEGAVLLDEMIRKLGMQVEVLAGVHSRKRTYVDLQTAINKRKQQFVK